LEQALVEAFWPPSACEHVDSPPSFNFAAVNAFLLRRQHLTPETRIRDVLQIVRDTGGLHATSGTTPYLSLLARSRAFKRASLDRELYQSRTLVRIRCVRGTIYMQTRDWMAAYLAATRRRNLAQAEAYTRRAGISDHRYAALSAEITALLVGAALPASSIRRALGLQGDISSLLYRMCDEGLLLRDQPEEGRGYQARCYRLFREVFPDVEAERMEETAARQAVVEQYLRCFGPATEDDVVWWTGFGKSEVRRAMAALAGRLVEVTLGADRRPALLLREDLAPLQATRPGEEPVVVLLPILDGYLMGYRERNRYLRPAHRAFVFDRGGNVTSTILVDGTIAGVWDWEDEPRPQMRLHYLMKLRRETCALIEASARQVGHFLCGKDVDLLRHESMIPVTEQSAGGFQSPLRASGREKRTR
jgi:hypothetical protein